MSPLQGKQSQTPLVIKPKSLTFLGKLISQVACAMSKIMFVVSYLNGCLPLSGAFTHPTNRIFGNRHFVRTSHRGEINPVESVSPVWWELEVAGKTVWLKCLPAVLTRRIVPDMML
ncbi:MAG TPA: hypothetical protein DCY88_04055 [Cyanobacteria bacterium UBA11372]|nr:hypothetical protein [Cyanobacteria bacterium UBA11372]